MIFHQFRHEEGGCLSYIIGCSQQSICAVIDPQYGIDQYLKYARDHNLKITQIFETHAQADHLSGARLLWEACGAPVRCHATASATFSIERVSGGDEITLGNILLRVLHTPGHTADSISILASDRLRSKTPWLAFTGDTLFVGDTGRPDLDGDPSQLYDSIWSKLLTLEDYVEIYPTHFANSSCGRAMNPKPSSTIGFERLFNPSLQVTTREEFIRFVMTDLPVQPPRFQKVRQFNLGFLKDPPIDATYDISSLQISVEELKRKIDRKEEITIVDVRDPDEYAKANIGGKLIPLGQFTDRFKELNPTDEIIVHCHHGGRGRRAVEFLYDKGFKNVKNVIGGIDAWSMRIDSAVPRY